MALFGYLLSTVVFAAVLILSLVSWRERLLGVWLQLALLLTVVWSAYLALISYIPGFNPATAVFFEILRNGAWLLFVLKLYDFGRGGEDFWASKPPWYALFTIITLTLLNLVDVFSQGWLTELGMAISYLAPLLLATVILVVAEQWFRNIPPSERWPVKFLLVAICLMFCFDFLLFSEALLFKRIDSDFWQARGFITAMAAPLIAVSLSRARGWNRELRVSRRAIFFSTSLLLSGLYLLLMSLVGYYLKWFGQGLGNAIQIIFLVAALTTFVLLVSSGRVRSLVAVWLNKHFLSYKYDYRDEWMRANGRFASLPLDDDYYRQLLLGICEPMDSNGGGLWIKEQQLFSSRYPINSELDIPLTPEQDAALLRFMETTGWVINVKEYQEHPEHYADLEIRAELLTTPLWLLVPLLHQGQLVGIVALAEPRAEHPVNWEDYDLLKALAGQLAALIELKRTSESLSEARQFEAFNQLSAFVVHDLKNTVAQLSLVVRNAEKHKHNPEFVDDALETLSNAVSRMNRLLSQLRKQSQQLSGGDIIDLAKLLERVVNRQQVHLPIPLIDLQSTEPLRIQIDKERFADVLCHLVQNAQDATPDSGTVCLTLARQGGEAILKVTDSGCGMDQQFIRNRLFKPFDTTKGSAGMGIGVYEAKQFIASNRGSMDVISEPGKGTEMVVRLPLIEQLEMAQAQ